MGWKDYPRAVLPTLLMEFCQALAFYGTQSIFTVYMISWLQLDDSTSMAIYHTNNVLVYVFTVVGGVIADDKLGKYNTLLITSIIYSIGFVTISLTALPPKNVAGFLVGLALVALGSSGVKPLIPAIGADQFTEDQAKEKEAFFGIYYMARNIGAFLGLFGVPLLRVNVECFDGDCYAVAYGIPAGLIFLGTLVFIACRKLYRKIPPCGGIMITFMGCIWTAIKTRWTQKNLKKEHWLDYADPVYEVEFIEECKSVMRVLLMMTPWPFYWALYDQMGSLWIIQASEMNGEIGGVVIHPDQTSAMNSMLIVLFVPLLHQVVYPLMDRCGVPNRLLQRVGCGMFITSLSFLIGGFVMLVVNDTSPTPIPSNVAQFHITNTLPCSVNISLSTKDFHKNLQLRLTERSELMEVQSTSLQLNLSDMSCYEDAREKIELESDLILNNRSALIVHQNGKDLVITSLFHPLPKLKRAPNSKTGIRVMNALGEDGLLNLYRGSTLEQSLKVFNNTGLQQYTIMPLGRFHIEFKDQKNIKTDLGAFKFGNGAYNTIILQRSKASKIEAAVHEDVDEYQVSMLWVIPQFVCVSFAETLFSVNSLEFSYVQAPASMKGVMTGFFMLTIAMGNIVVTVLAKVMTFENRAITFFVYTGLEILAFLAFVLLAIQYKYVTYEIDEVVSEHGDADHQRRRTLSCSHSELTARAMRKKSNVHENDGFENTRF